MFNARIPKTIAKTIARILIICLCPAFVLASGPMLTGNPLANFPSQPGSTVSAISAMGDNQWLNLGAPAPDPVWGRAYGRSWCGSGMVLAPEKRGAMFTGEGTHGGVKPDGYGLDDWWFYDINAHKWICIFPGTDTRNFNQQVTDGEIKVDSLGRVVDISGQPMPGHIMIHVYHWLTFDPDLRKFVLFPTWNPFGTYFMPGGTAVSAGITALTGQGMNKSGPIFGPWTYDLQTGRFERNVANNACPLGSGTGSFPFFQYISSKKQYFLAAGGGSAFFNPSTKTWSSAAGSSLSSYDFSGCYDSKRDRVYVGNSNGNFFSNDIQTGVWRQISFPQTASFSTNSGSITYDSLNDRVVVMDFTSHSIFVLNPEDNTWATPIPFSSAFMAAHFPQHSVLYDPQLGVYFIFTGYDSNDDVEVWAYKFRRTLLKNEQEDRKCGGFGLSVSPNPLTPAGRIAVKLPFSTPVNLSVFDQNGCRLTTIASRILGAGRHDFKWDAMDARGNKVPAGLYVVRLSAGKNVLTYKTVITK